MESDDLNEIFSGIGGVIEGIVLVTLLGLQIGRAHV